MADTPFTFRLVTPQRLLLEARVVSLQAPGSEGYLGVLANHAALITSLQPGRLDVRDEKGARRSYAVGGGFLEVSGNRATVLADSAEPADAIDRARAEAAKKRAEDRLRQEPGRGGAAAAGDGATIDRERAMRALERAKNRLAVSAA
jgi:F-type H+-transporting ATPase subunit epsilon